MSQKKKKIPVVQVGDVCLFGTYSVLAIEYIVSIKCPNIYLCNINKYYYYYPNFISNKIEAQNN